MEAFAIRNKTTGVWLTTTKGVSVWNSIGAAKNVFFNKYQSSINNRQEYEIVRLVPEN